MTIITKQCNKCKQNLDREENFNKNKGYRDGYFAQCKQCRKNHPSQVPEKVLQRVRDTRLRNKRFVWNYYSSHPCVDCGESDPLLLDFDHISDNKLANVSKLVHNTRSLKVIQKEIDKCEVVCANCHRRRTAKVQGWYLEILS